MRGGAVIHPDKLVYEGSRDDARVVHLHYRRFVVARCYGDLHVADHAADHHPVAPLLDQDGDVVFASHHWRIPRQVASHRVDGDVVGGGRERVARDVLAVVAATVDEAVRQTVALGVVGTRIVVERHMGACVVQWRVQQLR